MNKKLFLIDGFSYFFRAYYAIQNLSNSKGIPTNAAFGFTNMLVKILEEFQPDFVVLALDSKGPSFRKKIYEPYKANRDEMPDDLAIQIPFMKEIARAYQVTTLELSSYEADDIIATLVRRFRDEPIEITIVSGDKDLLQMVNGRVSMLDTMRNIRYNEKEVLEKYGVRPDQLLDYFSLVGDSSDNIPGVPGIGPKTASKLIQSYGTLTEVLKNSDQIKSKSQSEKLKKFSDQAILAKKLIRLDENVPIDCDLDALEFNKPDWETLRSLFQQLEFKKILSKLEEKYSSPNSLPEELLSRDLSTYEKYCLIVQESQLKEFLQKIQNEKLPLSVDLETTSIDPMIAQIVGISLCAEKGKAVYIPIAHQNPGKLKQPSLASILKCLKPILENPSIGKRGQNLKYDHVIFLRHGIDIKGIAFDSMLASYLLQADQRGVHNFDSLCKQYLDHQAISYDAVTEGIPNKDFSLVPLDKALQYAGEDADMVLQLEEVMFPLLTTEGLAGLLKDVENPLSEILARMEFVGIAINQEKLRELSREFKLEIKDLTQKIYALVGEEFAIQSPKQLQKILFEKLKFPKGRKTKTGYSTDSEVLSFLSQPSQNQTLDSSLRDIPDLLLRYRKITKLKSTYLDSLPDLIHPETGRIHTRYNQAIAATGRLSSSSPNLQNIPVRDLEGELIRSAFVADKGNYLLGADYSQIELRIFAHFSEDERLVRAYRDGLDIHETTAMAIFHCESSQVTSEMRRRAKTINFGILYGMSEFRLARELGISNWEAKEFIEGYFISYPQVKSFLEETIAQGRKDGFVRTYLGRKRMITDLNHTHYNRRKAAERVACSTRIQGSAADLIKVAMIRVVRRMEKEQLQAKMILQVHDELLFELPQGEQDILPPLVCEEMENVWKLKVPLKVETRLGDTWLEVH